MSNIGGVLNNNLTVTNNGIDSQFSTTNTNLVLDIPDTKYIRMGTPYGLDITPGAGGPTIYASGGAPQLLIGASAASTVFFNSVAVGPQTNGGMDLGQSLYRWNNLYVNTINVTNIITPTTGTGTITINNSATVTVTAPSNAGSYLVMIIIVTTDNTGLSASTFTVAYSDGTKWSGGGAKVGTGNNAYFNMDGNSVLTYYNGSGANITAKLIITKLTGALY